MTNSKNYIKILAILILCLSCVIATIKPLDMQSYLLHQLGTLCMFGLLVTCNYKIHISTSAYLLYCTFLVIHVIAAHYLYSYVPYNIWIKTWFHFDINGFFGWQRNMFDRFVHFAYGLLLFPFFYQVLASWLKPLQHYHKIALVCIMWIMASSMFYEIIEWWIAIAMSPETAENYNGQQGDNWDAHKDMLLALLGSLLAWSITPPQMLAQR